MFELVALSQPEDTQSLAILKDAYARMGRADDLVRTACRIAAAHAKAGNISSAILEYESVLQHSPDHPGALQALAEIQKAASSTVLHADDGRETMFGLFVNSKLITAGDFDLCWPQVPASPPATVVEPFIQTLAERGTLTVDKALRVLCEKSRLPYLPMDRYDADYEVARHFPADTCRRWCVLPFDRISRVTCVATVNPYNQQATLELEAADGGRLAWYLSPPQDIIRALNKAFR